jgi:hypothetical protein
MKYFALRDIKSGDNIINRGSIFYSDNQYSSEDALLIEDNRDNIVVNENKPEEKEPDKKIISGTFICPICGKIHNTDSKIGREHLEIIDSGEYLRKKEATMNLVDFKNILDKLKVKFWLEHGTLLGAYRDKDFCEGDEVDIDLGTWATNKHLIPKIIKSCEKEGFELYHHWDADGKAPEISFIRSELKIDLFFFEKKGWDAYCCMYGRGQIIPYVVRKKYFNKFKKIDFRGTKYNIPFNIEEYLKVKYGNWKNKISHKEYVENGGCYNQENAKPLNPNYKI